MKKGFTLIELLAVIVVLAIIALIAVPRILNVVDKAKISSERVSALGYIDAVEKQIIINQLDSDNSNDITTGVYTPDELKLKGVKVKGQTPSEGWVQIGTQKVEDYSLKSSTKSKIVINYDKTKKDAVVDFSGNIKDRPDGSSNAFTGTVYKLTGTNGPEHADIDHAYPVGTSMTYMTETKWCGIHPEYGNSCDFEVYFESKEECESYDNSMTCEQKEVQEAIIDGKPITLTTSASSLNSNKYYRYKIVNNLITESTVCGVNNNKEFCFDGTETSPYTKNIKIATDAFGTENCEYKNYGLYCTSSTIRTTIYVYNNGEIRLIYNDHNSFILRLPDYVELVT